MSGTAYSAELFAGPSGITDSSLLQPCTSGGTAAILSFRTGSGLGYIASSPTLTVPGVPDGSVATLQLCAWNNVGGTITSFAAARSLGAGVFGASQLWTVPLPANLSGMMSFTVPEPGTITLGLLGVTGFLVHRRNRKGL